MRPVLLAAAALLVPGPAVTLAQDSADTPTGRKLAAIKKGLEADVKDLKKKLAGAKDMEERKQVNFLIKEKYAFAAGDAVELAEADKKGDGGRDAAVYALELLGKYQITGDDMNKAIAILTTNHIDSPKIGPALHHMVEAGRQGQIFLEEVLEKAMNKEVQALALFYNAVAKDNRIRAAEGPQADPVKVTAARGEAIDMMEKAAKLAPDVKVGDEPLSKVVAREVVALRIGVGNPVPDIEGTDLDGKKVTLSSYKGKVVLFDFWATWCGPCLSMVPHERELAGKMKGKPFALLGVNVDDEKDSLTEFLGREKMPWDHWYDGPTGPVTKLFKVHSYPTLYLIDAKGVVRKKWLAVPKEEELDKAVEELVAEAEKGK